MPQIYDMGPTALLPLRREACWGFFRPKNPTSLIGRILEVVLRISSKNPNVSHYVIRKAEVRWYITLLDIRKIILTVGHIRRDGLHRHCSNTGCGRKNSPIWEANKFKIKEIRQMFFYFWKSHRMPFYINVFWTNHHSSGGLEYW